MKAITPADRAFIAKTALISPHNAARLSPACREYLLAHLLVLRAKVTLACEPDSIELWAAAHRTWAALKLANRGDLV